MIPLTPRGAIAGGPSWEPVCEHETLLGGGKTQSTRLKEGFVVGLYRKLSKSLGQTPEAFHFDDFEFRDGKLYYRDKSAPLMNKRGELR